MTQMQAARAPTDWRRIKPPARLAQRPRDRRGFIIPFSVHDNTDHPDFRITNLAQVRTLLQTRACWLCGLPPDYWMCFIGGPLSIRNRLFTDGWMHEACGVYALRVCPFLASPNGRYTGDESDLEKYDVGMVHPGMAPNRPQEFGLGFTHGFRPMIEPSGGLVLRAEPWRKVRWYSAWGQVLRTTRN